MMLLSPENLSSREFSNAILASSIPDLMSFLLNYSVSKGSYLKFQPVLEPRLFEDLIYHCDQMVQDTISVLKFQEQFYHTVFLQPRVNESLFIRDRHIAPKFSGFIAITIALMLGVVPEALYTHIISVISNWRQLIPGVTTSTIENFAFTILYFHNLDIGNLIRNNIETTFDLELKMSQGLELARYQRARDACAILGSCVEGMQIAGCTSSRECCVITTELVKCCNLMSEEAKAESIARQVLESQRDPQLHFQHDLCHLQLALADTLIGQGEYKSAETLMLDVLAVVSLSRCTQTVTRLRLNKARRRLGRNELITSAKAGFMQPVLESIVDSSPDLKIEIIAELSATVSSAPERHDTIFEGLNDLIHNTVVAIGTSSNNWRVSALVQDLDEARFRSLERGREKEASWPAEEVPLPALRRAFSLHQNVFQSIDFDARLGINYSNTASHGSINSTTVSLNSADAENCDIELGSLRSIARGPPPLIQRRSAISKTLRRLFSRQSRRERPGGENSGMEQDL